MENELKNPDNKSLAIALGIFSTFCVFMTIFFHCVIRDMDDESRKSICSFLCVLGFFCSYFMFRMWHTPDKGTL